MSDPGRPVVLRRATVLTMDPELGDVTDCDVSIADGVITGVGPNLPVAGRDIDLDGHIVMPGLIDTHWHLWTTLLRSLSASSPHNAYFAHNRRVGPLLTPDESAVGVRLSLAGAIAGGITTVHNWSHNLRSPAYVDAELDELEASGIRARMSYGSFQGMPGEQPLDLVDVRRFQRRCEASSLVHAGIALRTAAGPREEDRMSVELDLARELDLPTTIHAAATRKQGAERTIARLRGQGVLGPTTQVVHALYVDEDERVALAESGTTVSVSPWSEMLIGYGLPSVEMLRTAGVLVALSLDTLPLGGSADPFSVMRLTAALERGRAEDEFALSARDVLAMATTDAARALGLHEVGSIAPGKRADLIALRTDKHSLAPVTDPVSLVVTAAAPSNVDLVLIDGVVVKEHGRLTWIDEAALAEEAHAAWARVDARSAGLSGVS